MMAFPVTAETTLELCYEFPTILVSLISDGTNPGPFP